jgi:hypothetical protein
MSSEETTAHVVLYAVGGGMQATALWTESDANDHADRLREADHVDVVTVTSADLASGFVDEWAGGPEPRKP